MTKSLLNTLAVVAMTAGALAHGTGATHIMGTVTAVAGDRLDVKTKEGATVTIALAAKVELLRLEHGKESPATRAELRPGRRIVADVTQAGAVLTATRVVLSPAAEVTAEVRALSAVVDAYRAALVSRSVEQMEAMVTSDLLVFEGVSKNVGWKDYRDNHIGPEMKTWQKFEVLDVKTVEAQATGAFGYVVQESTLRIVTAEGPIDLVAAETFVLRKDLRGWRICHVHYSGKKKSSPASPAAKP